MFATRCGCTPARLSALRGVTAPPKNTLSHANRTRDPKMAEQLFWAVLAAREVFWGTRAKDNLQCRVVRKLQAGTQDRMADFLGHSERAVKWQVWTAVLAYVLLRFCAYLGPWPHSFTRLFALIRSALWQNCELRSLLEV